MLGRVTIRATSGIEVWRSPDLTGLAPGAPVQVPPAFLSPPFISETALNFPAPSPLPDLAVALRWGVPDEMRRRVLLMRGFQIWRTPDQLFSNAGQIKALEDANSGLVKRLIRSSAPATKLFRDITGPGTGPYANDFGSDRTTWFVTDDGGRYHFDVAPPAGQIPVYTGAPLTANQSYKYVMSGVDLLGRYTNLSTMAPGVAVRTAPPIVPNALRVENIVVGGTPRLRITFKANNNLPDQVPTTSYLLFRDRAANTSAAPDNHDLNKSIDTSLHNSLIYIGSVNHTGPGGAELSFIDSGLAPFLPAHYGQTYFYSIRAAHYTPFGLNVSAPSPPVFGTMRDREGPPAPTGLVATEYARPGLTFADESIPPVSNINVPEGVAMIRLQCERADAGITAMRITLTAPNAADPGGGLVLMTLPDLYFGQGNTLQYEVPVGVDHRTDFSITARAVTSTGALGHIVSASIPSINFLTEKTTRTLKLLSRTAAVTDMVPENVLYWTKHFKRVDNSPTSFTFTATSGMDSTYSATFPGGISARSRTLLLQRRSGSTGPFNSFTTARLPAGSTQFSFNLPTLQIGTQYRGWEVLDPVDSPPPAIPLHDVRPAGATKVTPVQVTVNLPAGAHEYRLYRRINDGPLFMLKQDTGTWDPATVASTVFSDGLIPPAGGRIVYFGQTFDQHGNPSPMVLLDQKIGAVPVLPVPLVDAVESGGSAGGETMIVRATCASPGVQRMEIKVTPSPLNSFNLVSVDHSPALLFNFKAGDAPSVPQDYASTLMGQLTPDLSASQEMVFNPSVRVLPAVEYTFQVRAIGLFGEGEWSAKQTFIWTAPLAGNTVPWPVRPVPYQMNWSDEVSAFLPDVSSFYLSAPPSISAPPQRILSVRSQANVIVPATAPALPDNPLSQIPVAVQIGTIPLDSGQSASTDYDSNWDVFGASYRFSSESFFNTWVYGNLGLKNIPGFASTNGPANLMHQFLARKTKLVGDISTYDFSVRLLPVVLYRQQTARSIQGISQPVVNADVVQVSPMITGIAWRPEADVTYSNDMPLEDYASIVDPYVRVVRRESLDGEYPRLALCLFDTAPVAAGATYQYFLVHFNPLGEPDGVIDAGTVPIPANP